MKFNQKGKVIVLNTNAAYNLNWRLYVNRYDPGHILQWLENELKELEDTGGFAYIMGHVSPEHFLHQFGIRYQALTERFQHIIRFQSFSHLHHEFYYVDKAIGTDKASGWGMVHGSTTTFIGHNPMFYVIEWDEETMVPVNIHTYTTNLTAANLNLTPNGEPEWYELHDYINYYNITDISPASMMDLSNQFYENITMAQKYENS